jgi:hypothetical protein
VIGYDGPITLELEDAPGASHYTHTDEASPALDRELAMTFFRESHAEAAALETPEVA